MSWGSGDAIVESDKTAPATTGHARTSRLAFAAAFHGKREPSSDRSFRWDAFRRVVVASRPPGIFDALITSVLR
jgi:hypothetical protein